MFEWLFGKKKDVEEIREGTRKGFESVKTDLNNLTTWIKHLNSQDEKQDFKISDINAKLSSIENDIDGIKNTLALLDMSVGKQLFKTGRRNFGKQTAVHGVYSAVQTAVQTAENNNISLSIFSVMERALISILLNTDMKLSYDDLAAMTGKSRATIRGQVNTIKQKSEGLIEEIIEPNGKKRVYIPDEIREKMLKNVKVRVNRGKKGEKSSEIG